MLNNWVEWAVFTAQKRRIARQFKQSMGVAGNFDNPKSYQEKMQFRKLYGNHAFYALAADKYRVRRYVADKVGEEYLIPLLGVYDRIDAAVFDSLPEQFIIKANHGCKWHEIVRDKRQMDVARTVRRFNTLCRRRYGWAAGERHYNFIPPKIVIEELLPGYQGGSPWDYSFFCFRGPNGFDYTLAITTPDGKSASVRKDWTLRRSNIPEADLAAHMRPANFDALLEVARNVSVDFDFVRVDLYSVGGKVYFGELTCTPHQGYGLIDNPDDQRRLDEMWQLDAGNPLLYSPPATHRGARRAPLRAPLISGV